MNEMMIHSAEPREIIRAIIDEGVPAIVSYMSHDKWHVTKVRIAAVKIDEFSAEVLHDEKPHPLNIKSGQQVGVSVKYGYGKFVFESVVTGLEPSSDSGSGGRIVFKIPSQIELVQRRNYFRVNVPKSLKVDVAMWHCNTASGNGKYVSQHSSCCGKLIDISAGGIQVAIEADRKPDFREGQTVRLKFAPAPCEASLTLNAQIRSILSTADGDSFCFGLQIIGLEASPEGRLVLQRLCGTVEQYYQINHSDMRRNNAETPVPVSHNEFDYLS